MIELLKEFKKVEGNKGTKRPDFFYQFGCFKIKKMQDTKQNREKAKERGTLYQGFFGKMKTFFYLILTQGKI